MSSNLQSLEYSATGPPLPPEMVDDLRTVAKLNDSDLKRLCDGITHVQGVLTNDQLEELTKQIFEDDAVTEAVTRTIRNIPPEIKRDILAIVDRWRHVTPKRLERFPDRDFESLQRNLELLVQDYPGVALMRKAERLVRDTGNEFNDVLFICDLRPIFNEEHSRVEGFLAIVNLRLRYLSQNGDTDVFELALTEDELETLIEKAQKAIHKLSVLRDTVHDLKTVRA